MCMCSTPACSRPLRPCPPPRWGHPRTLNSIHARLWGAEGDRRLSRVQRRNSIPHGHAHPLLMPYPRMLFILSISAFFPLSMFSPISSSAMFTSLSRLSPIDRLLTPTAYVDLPARRAHPGSKIMRRHAARAQEARTVPAYAHIAGVRERDSERVDF
ncbi:hypothetical protein FIBSPDRAFT_230225 [Athelia psychrophila]|uniref:Uncharacterized protein n=1 Tax=Athelia psychrophila TaxID=1759441 RepID=A0A165YPY2_9AGAM|nr:hypothetical protein FIBSPDRAFT_230225 [Fibularhizoctonia sp. CBS 109695]